MHSCKLLTGVSLHTVYYFFATLLYIIKDLGKNVGVYNRDSRFVKFPGSFA